MPKRPPDRIDKLIRRMWTAFILLSAVVVGVGFLWVHDVTSRVRTQGDIADIRLERAELAICARVQRIRMNTNRNSTVLYEGIRLFAISPGLPHGIRGRLVALTRVPQYQAPTDCKRAVEHPESYRPNPSIRVDTLTEAKRQQLLIDGR